MLPRRGRTRSPTLEGEDWSSDARSWEQEEAAVRGHLRLRKLRDDRHLLRLVKPNGIHLNALWCVDILHMVVHSESC